WVSNLKFTFPIIAMVIAFLLIRLVLLDSFEIDNDYIGVQNNLLSSASSFQEELATAIYFQWKYFKLCIMPNVLIHDYSFKHLELQQFTSVGFFLGLASLSLIIFLLFKEWKKSPVVIMGVVIYFFGLFLVCNLFIKI